MEYSLQFTEQELVILNDGLVRLPFGQVAALISKINEQLGAQRKAVNSPTEPVAQRA